MKIAKKVDEKQLTETEIQLSRKLNKIPRWDWNRSSSILHPRSKTIVIEIESKKTKRKGIQFSFPET